MAKLLRDGNRILNSVFTSADYAPADEGNKSCLRITYMFSGNPAHTYLRGDDADRMWKMICACVSVEIKDDVLVMPLYNLEEDWR